MPAAVAERIVGRATARGTASYARRFQSRHRARAYHLLGATGLMVSRVGFGGYRAAEAPAERALQKALLGGCNLIDTAAITETALALD